MSSSAPIVLLFGMPRSGTTWIGKIFDSHPETLYRHEPDSWGRLNAMPLMPPLDDAEQHAPMIQAFCAELPGMTLTKVAGSTPVFPKAYYSALRFNLYRLSVAAAKTTAKVLGEQAVRNFIRTQDLPRIRLVWKSIESMGRLGVIVRATRPSIGIHIARHPCGYVASVLRGEARGRFTSGVATSEDYGLFEKCLGTRAAQQHGITLDRLRAMHPVERLAWRWVLYNAKALEDIAGEPNCMTLRYEDLCRDPHGVAQQLFQFSGLTWNPQTERFVSQSTAKEVERYYSVVKDPLKSAFKWKDELDKQDIERILGVVAGTTSGALYERE